MILLLNFRPQNEPPVNLDRLVSKEIRESFKDPSKEDSRDREGGGDDGLVVRAYTARINFNKSHSPTLWARRNERIKSFSRFSGLAVDILPRGMISRNCSTFAVSRKSERAGPRKFANSILNYSCRASPDYIEGKTERNTVRVCCIKVILGRIAILFVRDKSRIIEARYVKDEILEDKIKR